jgi:PAS domain S-box-containing protein
MNDKIKNIPDTLGIKITEDKHLRDDQRRQELILNSFFNQSQQMMGIVQLIEGDILHVSDNPVAAQFFGRPVEFLRNKKSSELGISQKIIEFWTNHYLESKRRKESVKFEYEHDNRFFRVIVTFISDEKEGPLFSYLIEDQTILKLHEKSLDTKNQELQRELREKESEYILTMSELGKQRSIFETILQTSSDIIYVKDEKSRMIYANEATIKMIGKPIEEIIGFTDIEFFGPDSGSEEILLNDKRIMTRGVPETVEEKVFDKVYLSSKAPFKDQMGKIIGILGISKDITAIKRTEAQLREALLTNEKLLRTLDFEKGQNQAILNQMPAAVIVGEAPSGKLIYGNKRMNEVWGFSLIKSNSIDEYQKWVGYHPDGSLYQPHEWPLARSITKGEIVNNEEVEIIRHGQKAILSLSSCPIHNKSGEIIAGVVICQDVSELRKAIRSRDEFLSIASHELKTPLTSLKLQAQLMKRNLAKDIHPNDQGQVFKLVDQLDRQTTRLNKIVDDMLDVARVRTGKLKLTLTKFDLCHLTKEVVARMRLQQPDVTISLEDCDKIEGTWDMDRLEQVLMNLISNGIKYGMGKPVQVILHKYKKSAVIQIRDSGMGIERNNLPIIFDKFERGGIEAKDISGMGIGLFITKQIVIAHGGSIEVDSIVKKGSTFTVMIPLESTSSDISVTD